MFKRRQDELNTIFFKKELRTMREGRSLSVDKYQKYNDSAA